MFSKFFINRPVFASVVSIIIVISGLIGLYNSPVSEYPELTPPQVVVSAMYPGADAKTIAETVAAPLEDAINGVENMIYMKSTSSASGAMQLTIFFAVGSDAAKAKIDVSNRVNPAIPLLPDRVREYGVSVNEQSGSMLAMVAFFDPTGNEKLLDLVNFVKINVVDQLKRVDGVGDVSALGTQDYSMRIWLNPDLLKRFKITAPEIIAAIREQNSQYPTGKLGEQPNDLGNPYVYAIKPEGRLKTPEEFGNIILRASKSGNFLRLKDVAKVELGSENDTILGKFNGMQMAPIFIYTQNGANALSTIKAVQAKLKELEPTFPGNVTYSLPYDTTEFVQVAIDEVAQTLFEAMILVTLVIYMFLGNLRSTIIPLLAVPVSLCGAFLGIYAFGFSINLITLFALILAIGIVVDDAIIVIENVERILHEEPNLSVKEATLKSAGEIMSPVISIVLVLSAVFVPVAFMEGFTGAMERQFALTLVASVCFSGFVALTLTPALCALILRKKEKPPFKFVQKFNEFFDWSTKIFGEGVSKILKHVYLSLIFVAILFVALAGLFKITPSSLLPDEDKGLIISMVNLPSASSLPRTIDDMNFIRSILKKDPRIKDIGEIAGFDMFSSSRQENSGVIFMDLIDWSKRKGPQNSNMAIANELNKKLYMYDRNSLAYFLTPPPIMGFSMTGGFEAYAQNLTGKDYKEIKADMDRVVLKANKSPVLTMVRTTLDTDFPEYKLILNNDKIKMLGVNIADIFATISANIGQYYVNDFNLFGKTFKVNLRATDYFRDTPSDLNSLYVKSSSGNLVPVGSLVTLQRDLGPNSVERFNGFPAAKLMGDARPGYTSFDAILEIEKIIKEELGVGYNVGWAGTSYQEVHATGSGQVAFIFGMIFVFLILAAQYERWLMPVAVLTAVPFSVFGSLLFTWARGLSMDIYFEIGLLLLIGLAAKNAILIVEFAMKEHLEGVDIKEAAIRAAKLRFRPIIMTSLAFTLGVLPLVFASGAGAGSRHSIGTGVIGGMIAATTIAIFFVPLFFYLLESFNNWIKNRGKKGNNNA